VSGSDKPTPPMSMSKGRPLTSRAPTTGTVDAGGRVWQKYVRDIKTQNSLVFDGPSDLTTIITGDGTFEELTTFADHLQPFRP